MTRAGKTRACREDVRIKWSREKNREILLREGHAHGQTDMSDLTGKSNVVKRRRGESSHLAGLGSASRGPGCVWLLPAQHECFRFFDVEGVSGPKRSEAAPEHDSLVLYTHGPSQTGSVVTLVEPVAAEVRPDWTPMSSRFCPQCSSCCSTSCLWSNQLLWAPPNLTPDLTDVAERARTLVQKILRDIPVAHAAAISTKVKETSGWLLQLLSDWLSLVNSSPFPQGLTLDSAQLTNLQDICVSRMLVGCQMFQKLLGVLSERVDGLMDLKVTLRDLVTHITKMTETVRLNGDTPEAPSWDAASRLPGNYEAQMAAHLTLIQLRSFCHDLTRSLRAISTYRTSAA
ncbi:hypothetical protein fugu_015281 [Takifugu bimaculatus]|uniref:Uncharacterized protein n=1 Tax=Takifugu bimaculatus TaxID=433685 RepID=A0A4Z2BY66_9TELE|nr:hypothetical protein fugu_015281 [Takifugu bimaculatus]